MKFFDSPLSSEDDDSTNTESNNNNEIENDTKKYHIANEGGTKNVSLFRLNNQLCINT